MEISKNALDFLKSEQKTTTKKVSILEQYKDDIFYLKDNNIPITKIVIFLKNEHGIKTSYPNLLNWIKRQDTNNSTVKKDVVKSNNRNIVKNDLSNVDTVVTKYDNVDGTLKKHNLGSQIKRPSIPFDK